ncbi:unnamed protein product [Allacma fusca]|uniref:Uncharacterized protein n=1 Tax=Allacma fusca TaxID=39272 RepID=A0A8J2K8Y2_9HEXA|nr:unnamed protein product [Allacma fusca]
MDEDEDSLVIDVNQEKKSESSSSSNNCENMKSSNNATASSSYSKEEESLKVKDIMPPPPVPDSTSSSGFAVPIGNVTSPASNSSSIVSSLIANPVVTGSIALPVPTVTPVTTTVPIVSVHIVHSPQPNSPALLRSPLIVQSPHSSHASPYPIDDDLMDEALLGAGK